MVNLDCLLVDELSGSVSHHMFDVEEEDVINVLSSHTNQMVGLVCMELLRCCGFNRIHGLEKLFEIALKDNSIVFINIHTEPSRTEISKILPTCGVLGLQAYKLPLITLLSHENVPVKDIIDKFAKFYNVTLCNRDVHIIKNKIGVLQRSNIVETIKIDSINYYCLL